MCALSGRIGLLADGTDCRVLQPSIDAHGMNGMHEYMERMCMAFTITFAFPMVVIPARDIILRSVLLPCLEPAASPVKEEVTMVEALDEALEAGDYKRRTPSEESSPPTEQSTHATPQNASFLLRLFTAIGIFWTAVGVASGVDSLGIVGKSLVHFAFSVDSL
jgi:hypothetical protein